MWYKTFLPKLHSIIKPKKYVEIGIRHGYSLSLTPDADKIAIDPRYGPESMKFSVQNTRFFRMKSDEFFNEYDLKTLMPEGFDLAYIDGLHLFEFALRDFMNLERYARPDSIIIVDDVIPRNESEASRKASGGPWAGDVWKIIDCLREYRPDLYEDMLLARSDPTGCLILRKPKKDNKVLYSSYEDILKKYLSENYDPMPSAETMRKAIAAEEALAILEQSDVFLGDN